MAGSRLIFLDTETTGLDPLRHRLWNIGMVIVYPDGTEMEYEWMWWPDLSTADPMALRVNRFYDRSGDMLVAPWSDLYSDSVRVITSDGDDWYESPATVAHSVAHFLDGATVVGAIPWFDRDFIMPWLAEHGHVWTAHYHFIDVEALAAGWISAQPKTVYDAALRVVPGSDPMSPAHMSPAPPWNSSDLSRGVGVNPDDFDRHTALGDARWAKAIYEAVMGR